MLTHEKLEGTGKTTTVIEILLQLLDRLPESRVLVVAQSNSAANVILKRLIQTGHIDTNNTIRIVSYNFARQSKFDDELKPYYALASSDSGEECESITMRKVPLASLDAYRVVVTTTLSAGYFLDFHCMANHFTHALVDEAGQCSEMEVAIPMAIIGPRGKLVLVGIFFRRNRV